MTISSILDPCGYILANKMGMGRVQKGFHRDGTCFGSNSDIIWDPGGYILVHEFPNFGPRPRKIFQILTRGLPQTNEQETSQIQIHQLPDPKNRVVKTIQPNAPPPSVPGTRSVLR